MDKKKPLDYIAIADRNLSKYLRMCDHIFKQISKEAEYGVTLL